MGSLLLRTLTLAGAGGTCAIVALEKVPGLQDSIERVVPGFKDQYSQSRLATMDWYSRNSERVSHSIDSLTKKVKGVWTSTPSEPPPLEPKVLEHQKSSTPNAASKATSSSQAKEQQALAAEVGKQSVTQKSTEGSVKKDEVKPARKKEPVSQERPPPKATTPEKATRDTKKMPPKSQPPSEPVKDAGAELKDTATVKQAKSKMPEEPKPVSETTHGTKVPPKSQSPTEPVKSAELKGTTLGQRREVEDVLTSARKGFTTAAEMAVMSHQQTFAHSLSSALSSMEDVGAASLAQVAAKEQAALEKKHAEALKEYKLQKAKLEKAILLAKESSLNKMASKAEAMLKKLDVTVSALEHTADLAQKPPKAKRVLQPDLSHTDIPPPSVSERCEELTRLQGTLKASREEIEALTVKGKELEAKLEAALSVPSADIGRLVEEKVAEEKEKETLAHKEELEKQVSVLPAYSQCPLE